MKIRKTDVTTFFIIVVYFFSTLSLIYSQEINDLDIEDSRVIASQEVKKKTQEWIKNNPNANNKQIIHFLDSNLPNLQSIDDSYYVLANIINTYTSNNLPYTIYLFFAEMAVLKFDFNTAALMYYRSFEISGNYTYLLNSAIQEYQIGNLKKSNQYLTQILNSKGTKFEQYNAAIILKSELMLLDKSPEEVLVFLEEQIKNRPPHELNSSLLYQAYRIAQLDNNQKKMDLYITQISSLYPSSLEELTILNNKSVSTLPLPSLLFNSVFNSLSLHDNSQLQEKNDDSIISTSPKYGYQVGVFSNIANAKKTLAYYQELSNTYSLKASKPLIAFKTIDNQDFFQVIFPLSMNQTIREKEILTFQDKGIEGFLIIK